MFGKFYFSVLPNELELKAFMYRDIGSFFYQLGGHYYGK